MRKILLLGLLCLLVGVNAAQARQEAKKTDKTPQLTFEHVEHDFGTILESDGKVSCEYMFTNTGDCPLVITRIITSCKCVDASYTKKPIPPGGKGVVSITYNPRKQFGVFYKAIQVFSNAPEKMQVITVKGEVSTDTPVRSRTPN